jgi:hypothetical protein
MEKIEYTYLMFDGKHYKIGKSTDVKKRFKSLRSGNPDIKLIGYTDQYTESELHEKYKQYNYKLEWFKFSDDEIIDIINDFKNTDKDYIITYWKRLNIIFDEDTQSYISYNPTGYNLKNYTRFINPKGKYKLGKYNFTSKDTLRKFLRSLLDDLPLNEIITDKDIIEIVEDLNSYHPKHSDSLNDGYKHIKTKLDTEISKDYSSFKRYSNFCIVMNDDTEWNFSNVKCINNMDIIKGKSKSVITTKKQNNYEILTFGKYKGRKIDDILIEDTQYLKWAYENISEFKTKINKTEYKNIFKINFSVKKL